MGHLIRWQKNLSARDGAERAEDDGGVARRAGVSTATVSRVLAIPDRVAPSTRRRVTQAIEEMGYTLNLTARNLRVQSTRLVLALAPAMGPAFFRRSSTRSKMNSRRPGTG